MKIRFAEKVVFRIVDDLTDRRGFRQAWEECDHDTRIEIVKTWLAIVEREMEE